MKRDGKGLSEWRRTKKKKESRRRRRLKGSQAESQALFFSESR